MSKKSSFSLERRKIIKPKVDKQKDEIVSYRNGIKKKIALLRCLFENLSQFETSITFFETHPIKLTFHLKTKARFGHTQKFFCAWSSNWLVVGQCSLEEIQIRKKLNSKDYIHDFFKGTPLQTTELKFDNTL